MNRGPYPTTAQVYGSIVVCLNYKSLLDVLSILRILPESARWLLTQGRQEEAKKIILKAARVNGKELSESLIEGVIEVFLHKKPLNYILNGICNVNEWFVSWRQRTQSEPAACWTFSE